MLKVAWDIFARHHLLTWLVLAMLAMLAAPWLARAETAERTDWLAALDQMPESTEVIDARVLGSSYVGTIWRGLRAGAKETLVLYRLEATQPGALAKPSVSLTLEDDMVGMDNPSGAIIGGVPFLFVGHGPGGAEAQNMRIFKLAGEPQDVTPDWAGRVDRALDSGAALVVRDERWQALFAPCAGCGPVVDQVMDWTGIGYRAACQAHAPHYGELLDEIAEARANATDAARTSLRGLLDFEVAPALALIQMGRIQEGRAAFEAAVARARAVGAEHYGVRRSLFAYWLNTVERHIAPAVAAARPEFACPLTAWQGTETDARALD